MPGLLIRSKIRELTFSNRVFVSPMCQYRAKTGRERLALFISAVARSAAWVGAD
jgi:2,4-dienoyl-CoA reductase-like NADH-dependent reductase (Old Yellow Enzyme family)